MGMMHESTALSVRVAVNGSLSTLRLLEPGRRVWVNRPGTGYLGVGIVTGEPVGANEFMVKTPDGEKPYLEVGDVSSGLLANAAGPETAEQFVPVRWLKTVEEEDAIREPGLFGNQNSAAKPVTPSWPTTVARLKRAFGVDD